jgi:hypothetical protein
VVSAEGSRPRGRGFESRRKLDGCKRCYIFNEKGNNGAHQKNIYKKTKNILEHNLKQKFPI